jgi:hypothetical protein
VFAAAAWTDDASDAQPASRNTTSSSSGGHDGGDCSSGTSSISSAGSNLADSSRSSSNDVATASDSVLASSSNDCRTAIKTASHVLANLPASHSKLFALLGCDSMPLMLVAAARAEQLRANSTGQLRAEVQSLIGVVLMYEQQAKHVEEQAEEGIWEVQQHEGSVHFMVPSLLLHFAAQQSTLPAQQQFLDWHSFADIASQDFRLVREEWSGSYLQVPADLQQILLQDLLPMVVQIGTAVLDFPGPAAYRGYGGSSNSTQSSTAAVPAISLSESHKAAVVMKLTHSVCCAASAHDSGTLMVPTASLGSRVLSVMQLFEAAVPHSQKGALSTHLASEALGEVLDFLDTFCTIKSTGPGAFLEVAGSAAAPMQPVSAQNMPGCSLPVCAAAYSRLHLLQCQHRVLKTRRQTHHVSLWDQLCQVYWKA